VHKFVIFLPRNSKFKCQINYQNSFRKIKKKFWEKNFLEPGAFSDKQFCKNYRAFNFFAI
jgi:hypothetical protein